MKDKTEHEKTIVCKNKHFPFLDLKLFYNVKDDLEFRVHLKKNQKLKCLNKLSTHTKACFKAMPDSVFKRLARLTTMTEEHPHKTIDEVCPKHVDALKRAELVKNCFKNNCEKKKETMTKEK